jgi:hypothetical protein
MSTPARQCARAPPSGPRRGRCSDVPLCPTHGAPIPPRLGGVSSPLTCGQKKLQHHRRQQPHGPRPGGDREAAITLEAAAATERPHGSQAVERRRFRWPRLLPAPGCKPSWDLRAARCPCVCQLTGGPRVRPSPCTSVRPTSRVPRAACSYTGRLSAPGAPPGIRLREEPELRPARRRPLLPPPPPAPGSAPGLRRLLRSPGPRGCGGRT